VVDCLLRRLAPHSQHERAIFLVGSSGVGKSTLANWMLGSKIEYQTVEDDLGDEVTHLALQKELFQVGHGRDSKTLVPNVLQVPWNPTTVLIDFPGFKDNTSLEIRLGVDLAFREACKLFKSVHGLPKGLLTDCLDKKDCAVLQMAFMTGEWTGRFLAAQPSARTEHLYDPSFNDVTTLLQKKREVMQEFLAELKKDADALFGERKLGMERRNNLVKTLCGYQQCRLKSVFLNAEQRVLDEFRASIESLVQSYVELAEQLRQRGHMTADQFKEVDAEARLVRLGMEEALRREGYRGTQHFRSTLTASTGVRQASTASTTSLSWTSLNDGGSASTVSAQAASWPVAVPATDSVIEGWFADPVADVATWPSDSCGDGLPEAVKLVLVVLQDAFDAITEHKQRYQAMMTGLLALEIPESD